MPFLKARPQQARLKISLYGPPGSGKTFTALLIAEGIAKARGKRIAYIDTERGTDFYAQPAPRRVHPEAFDFDAIYTKSLSKILEEMRSLDPAVHGIVVVDSISHVWDAAMEAYEGRQTRAGTIPMNAWGKIKKPYKDLMNFLISSSLDVLILGRQKNVFEDQDGEMKKVGVSMRAEGETQHEPHICMRMECQTNPKNTTQSRNVAIVEKDRTGVLQGKTLIDPDFSTIEPLLPLLGETQAPAEDEDERIANDGVLLAQDEAKAAGKAEKSLALTRELQAKLFAAPSLQAVAEVAGEIKKAKRYLMDEHEKSLREIYGSVRDKLVQQTTGSL